MHIAVCEISFSKIQWNCTKSSTIAIVSAVCAKDNFLKIENFLKIVNFLKRGYCTNAPQNQWMRGTFVSIIDSKYRKTILFCFVVQLQTAKMLVLSSG